MVPGSKICPCCWGWDSVSCPRLCLAPPPCPAPGTDVQLGSAMCRKSPVGAVAHIWKGDGEKSVI